MKLLILIKGLGLGGAERHVVDSAIQFHNRGHEVTVAFLLPQKVHFITDLKRVGIPVELVKNGPLGLSKLLWTLRPDLVHAHLPVPAIYARILKPIFRYAQITTYHNVHGRQKLLIRGLERMTHHFEDVGISCSKQVADSIPWRTVTIRNGIDLSNTSQAERGELRKRLGVREDALICLCVANLLPKKNHRMLLRAFDRALLQIGPAQDVHLVLIGQDGTERASLNALATGLKSSPNIHFWGPDGAASKLAQEADVFCLASEYEGLPLALLEAMAAGLPSVVTDVGGMPDVVKNGKNGFVVGNGDEVAFSQALTQLFEAPHLCTEMGQAGRALVNSSFHSDQMIDRILKVYSTQVPMGKTGEG